jgi:two-component system CheB/CheR fusion protein
MSCRWRGCRPLLQQADPAARHPACACRDQSSPSRTAQRHQPDPAATARTATGHDFSLYKKSTIGRRIERRMVQHDIDDLAVYARYLKENPAEIQALFKELLINVTSFFRDPEAFVVLKHNILPPCWPPESRSVVFASGWPAVPAAKKPIRSPWCCRNCWTSTASGSWDFQIYATDIDDDAIATARAGRYPPTSPRT